MVRKPDIQYVGQFYIHGSEAQKLAPKQEKQPKTRLPLVRMEKVQAIYLDPVAIVAIAVAVVMLVTMVAGILAVQSTWQEYEVMEGYVSGLRRENARLEKAYRDSYDLEEIAAAAKIMGLVPRSEVQTRTISVTLPEPEPEPTAWEDFLWFVKGLFA